MDSEFKNFSIEKNVLKVPFGQYQVKKFFKTNNIDLILESEFEGKE